MNIQQIKDNEYLRYNHITNSRYYYGIHTSEEIMPRKKAISNMDKNELLELIDDQIYKHLPISKLTEIINKAISEFDPKSNKTLHGRLLDLDLRIEVFEGYGKPKKGKAA